jgi:hypothetical protein
MKPLTRRTFLTTSGMGAGLGLVAGTSATRALAQAETCTTTLITSNFNGTAINGGDFIWFNSVAKVQGLGSDPVTIGFISSIQFSVGGTNYVVAVPAAIVSLSPSVALATTDFDLGQWKTTAPLSGLAGNVFLTGVTVQAPMPAGFPGGIKELKWEGMFFSLTPGLNIQWKWAAAVYRAANFNTDYDALGVKPVDDNSASAYPNSDHAGTPENFKPYVVGGARGGGGSNFTGSYSGTAASTPCPADMPGGGGS